MFDYDKVKLVSVLLDGVAADSEPPPVHEATAHYEGIWSVVAVDNEPIKKKNMVDVRPLGHPIMWQEIEQAINNTNIHTSRGLV